MRFKKRSILRWAPAPWFGASFDYKPEIVEELKQFPIKAWDSSSKSWWFPDVFLPHVTQILKGHFGDDVPMLDYGGVPWAQYRETAQRYGNTRPNKDETKAAYTVVGVIPSVPDIVLDSAYNAMRYYLDPERSIGGSDEPLRALEAAYQTILAARGRVQA